MFDWRVAEKFEKAPSYKICYISNSQFATRQTLLIRRQRATNLCDERHVGRTDGGRHERGERFSLSLHHAHTDQHPRVKGLDHRVCIANALEYTQSNNTPNCYSTPSADDSIARCRSSSTACSFSSFTISSRCVCAQGTSGDTCNSSIVCPSQLGEDA